MEKCVVYAGTRNVYDKMTPAIKSCLKNANADKVYVLIEDDDFSIRLPEECVVINVASWADMFKGSPNFNCQWSYMILLRVIYSKIFPQLDRILSLDIDTIINKDISELWNIDMTGYYIAGCKEARKTDKYGYLYLNAGVMMYNLKEFREYGMDDRLLNELNTVKYKYCEQDAMSKLCKGHALEIDSTYNRAIGVTMPSVNPKVFHFAGHKDWFDYPEIKRYADMRWREVL